MLEIKNLHVTVEDKTILNGVNLQVNPGEIHAIMGPNGSGKSTLANVIAGRGGYTVTAGTLNFLEKNLLDLATEQRAHAGIFLSFQYPVEIPGVSNINFLKAAVNAIRKAQDKPEIDAIDFLNLVRQKIKLAQMDESFLYRAVNEGFSGGEKKRNELLQFALLEPTLAILDEADSGLDIDSLKIVAEGVNALRHPQRAMILVTHYQRLLNYIEPDFIHVFIEGKIVKSGDKTLALELEQKGYGWLE